MGTATSAGVAAVAPAAEAQLPPDPVGRMAAGLTLTIFGVMMLMIGGMLSGLCLIANGIICEGTGIGTIGGWLFLISLLLFIPGMLILVPARRAHRAAMEARAAANRARGEAQAQAYRLQLRRVGPEEEARGPVASLCPECGAPVKPGAPECEFCGTIFQ